MKQKYKTLQEKFIKKILASKFYLLLNNKKYVVDNESNVRIMKKIKNMRMQNIFKNVLYVAHNRRFKCSKV